MKANIFIFRTLVLIAWIGFVSCNKAEMEVDTSTVSYPDSTFIIGQPGSSFVAELAGASLYNMAIDNDHVFYFVTCEVDKEEHAKTPLWSSSIPVRYYLSRKSTETGSYEVLNDRFVSGKLCFDKQNQLWVYDYQTVCLYKDGKLNKIIELPSNGGMFQFLDVDKDNNIWAGGLQTGLYKVDKQLKVTHYASDDSKLPSAILDNIHVDKQNNVWVAGWGSVLKIANDKWTVYNSLTTGFTYQRIWSLVTDKNGYLWTGEGWDNENQSLNRFNGSVWETINPRNEKNEVVKGTVRILQSDGNKIYVVSVQVRNSAFYSNQLLTFDGIKWNRVSEIPENDGISQLIVDDYRKVVWVVMLNKGVFQIPF